MSRVSPAHTTTSTNVIQGPPKMDATVTDSAINVILTGTRAAAMVGYQGVLPTPGGFNTVTALQARLVPGTTTFNDANAPGVQTRDFYSTSEIWLAKFGEINNAPSPPNELIAATTGGDFGAYGGILFQAIYNAQGLTIGV